MNLVQLRQNVKLKSDELLTGFIPDGNLTALINQGYVRIYNEIVQTHESYFIEEGTALNGGLFDTISGQMSYALPTTLYKLVKVEVKGVNGDNAWFKVSRFNFSNDSNYNTPYSSSYGYGYNGSSGTQINYDIVGNKLMLRPLGTGTQNYTIRLWFVPNVVPLVLDTDVPIIPEMFHTAIAEFATIQVLTISGEKIVPRRFEIYQDEVLSMVKFLSHRSYQPETIVFDGLEDYTGWAN